MGRRWPGASRWPAVVVCRLWCVGAQQQSVTVLPVRPRGAVTPHTVIGLQVKARRAMHANAIALIVINNADEPLRLTRPKDDPATVRRPIDPAALVSSCILQCTNAL